MNDKDSVEILKLEKNCEGILILHIGNMETRPSQTLKNLIIKELNEQMGGIRIFEDIFDPMIQKAIDTINSCEVLVPSCL